MDDGDVVVGPRSLEFVDDGDGQVLGADPGSAVGADEQGVRNRFNPSPATLAMLDLLGVGAPHGQASAGDY
ncbi:hypothetical protein [Streptomyces sp. AK010]|uniref:hypothetical protein n=1 Tax=Streptomyces sp. AK010 TaxID=2723074 RepID=UPI00161BB16E|nr:hypothetical protein [Streptomyces sp. AK010]MBB6421085.1 hypothetical protein [Streptomyces sp. AK010]